LRQLLRDAPEDVKQVEREVLANLVPLTDDAYDTDPAMLYDTALTVVVAAERAGYKLPFPVSTEGYLARALALPDDLQDVLSDMGRSYDLPNFAHAHLWTPAHAEQVEKLLLEVEGELFTRRTRVMAMLTETGLNDDDVRHGIIRQLTGGRTESSKALTPPEIDCLDGWCQSVRAGVLVWKPEVEGLVDKNTGEHLQSYRCDWRSFAKANGKLTLAHLTLLARSTCERLGLAVPTKITDVTDHRVTAAIWRLVEIEKAIALLHEGGVPAEDDDQPEPPAALGGSQASGGGQDSQPAARVDPAAPQGPALSSLWHVGPVLMVPVPLSQLRAVLDALAWEV
jgi:hypothetical protein